MLRLEKTEAKIRAAILTGGYRAGERLVEADLIKKYKVSRPILREALRKLGASGLVDYFPKRGHSVKKFSIEEVKKIYDLIKVLEGYACEISVPFFSRQDINYQQKLQEKMESPSIKEDHRKYRELNILFHEKFATKSGNEVLKDTIINLRTRIYTYRYLSLVLPNSMNAYLREHEKIIEYVIKGDPKRVKLEMQKHIESVKNNLIAVLEKSPFI